MCGNAPSDWPGYPLVVTSTNPGRMGATAPKPLVIAAATTAAEGLVFLIYALLEILRTDESRVLMGATTSIFFLLYGAGLVVCAWRLSRTEAWPRSPVVLAQLIHLGLAWSFWGPETQWVSLCLVLVSAIVLIGLFHPASTRALADESDA